ncbi:MAG: two-component system, cell cycle response regulator [Parcubacteria bacterium C7867-006]|nr:MAG: two-component system, cell cycle response regulator [Parcubacteria bacterium C7867-006]
MDETQKLKEQIAILEFKINELEKDLIHDSLTGLRTRDFFEEETAVYLSTILKVEEGKRKDWFGFRNLSVLFFDIDNFKIINDTYGHDVGDMVLEKVSGIIKQSIREGDTAARWGGEEIVVSLLGANEADAKSKADDIRARIENYVFELKPELRVTISAGVASYENGIDLHELIKNADKSLYKAKESGRNKVIAFSEI